MELKNDIELNINNWPKPKKPEIQWKEGRSAKELANFFLEQYPQMPTQIESYLETIGVSRKSVFFIQPEHVTPFPPKEFGKGGGRNHDAFLYDNDWVIGIEAKADESLDKIVSKWLISKNENGEKRANKLANIIFGDGYENHLSLRYQLMTALGGILLEAKNRNANNAIFLIIIFLKEGLDDKGKPFYSNKKVEKNQQDIDKFLSALNYDENTGEIHTYFGEQNNIKTYFKEIVVEV